MNMIMKAISTLCNMQRDKYFKMPEQPKKSKKKGKGFDDILKEEKKKLEDQDDE